MFSACGYIYIFLEEVLFGEFGVIPVEEGYEEEIVCHGDPEGVPEVELDWLSKRKGLEVALGVEDLRIGVQMPKLHIIFHTHLNFQLLPEIPNHLCNSAASSNNNMAKFAQNEIIWALYSKQNQLWPAKVHTLSLRSARRWQRTHMKLYSSWVTLAWRIRMSGSATASPSIQSSSTRRIVRLHSAKPTRSHAKRYSSRDKDPRTHPRTL